MPKKEDYKLLPVKGVTVYPNDVVVSRYPKLSAKKVKPKRGEIMEFSEASRKRLAFVAANTGVEFKMLVTLTYPGEFPIDGKASKLHLRQFLDWCNLLWDGLEYLWFMEFQKRGAPHYHILLDKLPDDASSTMSGLQWRVSHTWYGIVKSGDPKHLLAGTRTEVLRNPEGGKRYAVKYAVKMRQKAVPKEFRNVGRFWGNSKGVKPRPVMDYTFISGKKLLELLKSVGWEYAPETEENIHRVLYNAAPLLAPEIAEKVEF